MAALWNREGHSCGFFCFYLLFPCLISAVADWMSVKQQYLLHMSHSMVNFGSLPPEIGPVVWGTPANFNRFHVLAALLHSSSGRQPSFAALNRGRHLYSAGQPSRWALVHISS